MLEDKSAEKRDLFSVKQMSVLFMTTYKYN